MTVVKKYNETRFRAGFIYTISQGKDTAALLSGNSLR
jgi:hypothetical protein